MATKFMAGKRIIGNKSDRDGLTDFNDSLESSADGSNSGIKNPNYSSNGLEFTGGEYVEVNGLRSTISGATSISMACWINPSDITDATILGFWNSGYEVIIFSINGSNKLQLVTKGADGNNLYMASSASISADTLTHVAFTYDTSGTDTVKLYINGALDSTHTTNVPTSFPSSSTGNVYIGSHSAGANYFDGTIKQYLVYSDVLTLSEIQTIYNSGTPVTSPSTSGLVSRYDFTANANDSQGSNNGTAPIKLGSGAYSFDGTDDYVTAGSTSDFTFLHDGGKNTITFWLKKDTPESGDVREILGTADGTSNGCEVIYLDRSSSSETRKVKIEFTNASSQQIGMYYAQEFFPNDSDWHHYAIVTDLSNSYLKAYVDGVEKTADSSYPSFTGTPVSTAQQHVLNIGRRNAGTFYLDGDLDDLSFWDRNLSTTEISTLCGSTGSLDSDDFDNVYGSTQFARGFKVATSSSALKDKKVKAVTFYVRKNGSATGTAYAKIYNGTTVVETNTTGTNLDVSTLGTSDYTAHKFEFTGNTTLDTGYSVVYYFDGGSGSAYTQIRRQGSDVYDGVNTIYRKYHSSAWADDSGTDAKFILEFADAQLVSSLTNKSGLKAHYGMNTANGTTASLDDDLSSYADQAAADNVWKSSDTAKVRVNISDDDIDFNSVEDDSNDSISYELGSTLSNTEWICRFKFNISTADNSGLAPGTDRHAVAIGLFDVDETVGFHSSTAKSAIYLDLHLDRDGTDRAYFARQNDATNSLDGAGQTGWSGFSTGTDYYCEIKRTSDANATMTIRTGSHTGSTALGTPRNLTTCAGIDNLKYFGIKCSQWGYGGQLTGIIDDVQIWSGTTDPDATFCTNDASSTSELDGMTNLPTNTIFLQTDDTPSYWWKQSDNTWKISGIPTPDAWWDMSASDTTVSNVTDKSGNGHTLVQSTSGNQPSVSSSARNGLNALQFTEMSSTGSTNGDYMITTDNMTRTPKQTVFYVGKIVKGTVHSDYNFYIWDSGSSGNHNAFIQYQDNWKILDGGSGVTSSETTWSTWRYLTVQYNGSSTFIRDNGTETTLSGGSLESGNDTTGFTLNGWNGKGSDGSKGQYGASNIVGEVIIYNRILSSTEIHGVEEYLKDKWGF